MSGFRRFSVPGPTAKQRQLHVDPFGIFMLYTDHLAELDAVEKAKREELALNSQRVIAQATMIRELLAKLDIAKAMNRDPDFHAVIRGKRCIALCPDLDMAEQVAKFNAYTTGHKFSVIPLWKEVGEL